MAKSSREIIRLLAADDWYEIGQTGSHKHFEHPTKQGKVAAPSDAAVEPHRIKFKRFERR